MNLFMQDDYSVYDSLPVSAAVFMLNDSLDVVYSNAVYNEIFAHKHIRIHSDREVVEKLMMAADTPKCIYFKTRDAQDHILNVRSFVVKISEDRAFALMIDDSQSAEMIKMLDSKVARYAAAITGTDEVFYEYSRANDTMTVFYSTEEDSIVSHQINNFVKDLENHDFIYKDDRKCIRDRINAGLGKEEKFEVRLKGRRANDNYEWFLVMMKADTRRGMYTGSMRNVNESKMEAERLMEKALIDPLSKVYNREAAIEKIKKNLAIRTLGSALAVLDIDNFKRINDTFGHLYGDAVIAMAADSIKSVLDEEDIMGRFGGDEFFIFFDNSEKEVLDKKLENIRQAILMMRLDKNDENDISCSVGVTLAQGAGADYDEMFKQADSALYLAKNKGKNRYEYFDGHYFGKGAVTYAKDDENESNAEQSLITVALEIAARSTSAENTIANLLRHAGMTMRLDCVQTMRFDTIEDKVHLDYQWWRERNGDYNVLINEPKAGYYEHNDLIIFRDRFKRDSVFMYTPDFKEGFSQKYYNVLKESEGNHMIYGCCTETESVFHLICFQCWDKSRVFTEKEMESFNEFTKILSMYLKTSSASSEREKFLINRMEYDYTGLYALQKFYDEAGRIGREARARGEILGVVDIDIKDLYGFNVKYGRETGDRVIELIAASLKHIDPTKGIACHIYGTDRFILLFRTPHPDQTPALIKKDIDNLEVLIMEYYEHPVIIKMGLAFFKPGQYIVNAMDAAYNVKKGKEFKESACYVCEEVLDEYPNGLIRPRDFRPGLNR